MFGWRWYHANQPRRDNRGWPDLALWHVAAGRFYLFELKAKGGKLTQEQSDCLLAACLAGVKAWAFWPHERQAILNLLDVNHKGAVLT